jgi:hypothetical protein
MHRDLEAALQEALSFPQCQETSCSLTDAFAVESAAVLEPKRFKSFQSQYLIDA